MITPQGSRVLVELDGYDLNPDGIYLVESYKEVLQTGIVKAIGDGCRYKEGIRKPEIEIDDKVLVTQTSGTAIVDGKIKYQLVSADKIQGVIE